jgi:hypothetical protein
MQAFLASPTGGAIVEMFGQEQVPLVSVESGGPFAHAAIRLLQHLVSLLLIAPVGPAPLKNPPFLREIRLGIEGRLWVESRPSLER